MDDDETLLGPGEYAAALNGDGSLPQDSGTVENLTPTFTPSLENLLPAPPAVDDDVESYLENLNPASDTPTGDLTSGSNLLSGLGLSGNGSSLANNSLTTSISNFLTSAGSSLLGAFVLNPQNATTAEQEAATQAGLTESQSSQIFGYLLIGLIIFLVFSFFSKE